MACIMYVFPTTKQNMKAQLRNSVGVMRVITYEQLSESTLSHLVVRWDGSHVTQVSTMCFHMGPIQHANPTFMIRP